MHPAKSKNHPPNKKNLFFNKTPNQKKYIVFNGQIISADDLRKAKNWYKFEINNCTVFNGDIVSVDDLRDTNQIIKRKSFLVWLKLLIKEAQQCLK